MVPEVEFTEDLSEKIAVARDRVEAANAAATDERTLGHRTTSALDYLYSSKDMGYLLLVLHDLGKNQIVNLFKTMRTEYLIVFSLL